MIKISPFKSKTDTTSFLINLFLHCLLDSSKDIALKKVMIQNNFEEIFGNDKLDIEFARILSLKTMSPKVDNIFFRIELFCHNFRGPPQKCAYFCLLRAAAQTPF